MVLTLASATACSSKSNDTQATSATVNYDAPTVTLTNAGAEPTQVLAYNLSTEETSRTLTVTQGFGQASGAPGVTPQVTSTELALPLTISGSSLTVGTPTGSNPDLNSDIASANGFGVNLTADAAGAVTAATFSAPAGASDVARSTVETSLTQLLSMPIVFPTTAIGTGATWDVALTVTDPTTIARTITYTLKSVEGTKVTLGVSVSQRPTVTSLALDQSALSSGTDGTATDTAGDFSATAADAAGSTGSADSAGGTNGTDGSASSSAIAGPVASDGTAAGSPLADSSSDTLDVTEVNTTMASGTVIVDLTSLVPEAGAIDETTRVTYRNTSNPTDDTVVVQDTRRGLSWK